MDEGGQLRAWSQESRDQTKCRKNYFPAVRLSSHRGPDNRRAAGFQNGYGTAAAVCLPLPHPRQVLQSPYPVSPSQAGTGGVGSLWLWRTGVQIRETTREAVLTEWPLRSLTGTRTRIVSEEPPDRA